MISVIIVNYGTADLAIEAVDSVLRHDDGARQLEIHLVDNASPDSDAAHFQEAHETHAWGDKVTIWPETMNHGFGGGNNVVLKALASRDASPDRVFLLNPDARFENNVLAILSDALDSDPEAVAAGAGIALPDGTQVSAAFRFPGFTSEVLKTVGIGFLERIFAHRYVPLPPDFSGRQVDWVAGAAVMFEFEALRKCGFFDPEFFLYFEEVDLMRRLQADGRKILFVPEAQVVHWEGAATNVSSGQRKRRRPKYVYDSWRYYYQKTHGRTYALTTSFAVLIASLLNTVYSLLRRRAPGTPKGFFRDHCRYVVLPLIIGRTKAS